MNQPTMPTIVNGYGVLAVTNASAAISTLTTSPNSASYPASTAALPNETFTITNAGASAGVLYVCPLGGTCTAAAGIPLAVGGSRTFNIGSRIIVPSVIAATTATAIIEW